MYRGFVVVNGSVERSRRVADSAVVAEVGFHEVQANLIKLGWGPLDNRQHDLGTDLLVHVRDQRRFDRGLLIGAQVKAGPSYFSAPTTAPDPGGWWYAEADTDHFDLWSTHVLPHLLILHDPNTATSYWTRVTPDRVVRTGSGAKILVPTANQIAVEQLPDLLEELSSAPIQRATNLSSVAPGDQLRCAILVPFLRRRIASVRELSPIDVIAMVIGGVDGRFVGSWQPPKRRTWLVAFAEAVVEWRLNADPRALRRSIEHARRLSDRCAAVMLLASHFRAEDRHLDVRRLTSELIAGDRLAPLDHAWCLVQRARSLIELDELDAALADAAEAARSLALTKGDDLVGRGLSKVASWMLFNLAQGQPFEAANVDVHEPIGRWRESLVADAPRRANADSYQSMSSARSLRFANVDVIAETLNAASLNADLLGDHATWCQIEHTAAQLQIQRKRSDADEVTRGVDRLRRAGATDSVRVIAGDLLRNGPHDLLAQSVALINPRRLTATSARASLALSGIAGASYGTEPVIGGLTALLLKSLAPAASRNRTVRILRSHVMQHERIRTLGALLEASQDLGMHTQAAALLTRRITSSEPNDFQESFAIASALDVGILDDTDRRRLIDDCLSVRNDITSVVLGQVVPRAGPEVLDSLRSRAAEGDLSALDALVSREVPVNLDAAVVRSVLDVLATRVRETVEAAQSGSFGYGGTDYARAFCIANASFGSVASWDPILELLSSRQVIPTQKVFSLRVLAEMSERLPRSLRSSLRQIDIPITATFSTPFDLSADGALRALRLELGERSGALRMGVEMAFGDADSREDLAHSIGRGRVKELRPILATMVKDPSIDVARASAQAIGRLAATADDTYLDPLLDYVTAHPGVALPFAAVNGLLRSGQPVRSTARAAMFARLSDSPSRQLRLAAEKAIERGFI